MPDYKIIDVKKSVIDHNDRQADALRSDLRAEHTLLLNLMSSPGSGKTTTLLTTIAMLRDKYSIGVMQADIDSDVDAAAVSAVGIDVVQLHTGGMCHLDAGMTRTGLDNLGGFNHDLVVLENVGNLVCPAEFDTGAALNVMILSVPEGDDKPLKYPLMFSVCDCVLINKIDTRPVFNFDDDAVVQRIRSVNPDAAVFFISARTGDGVAEWCDWLSHRIDEWNGTDYA